MAEITCAEETVVVPIEGLEDNVSRQSQIAVFSDEDERVAQEEEEAHLSFKMEDLDPNWASSIEQRRRTEPKRLKSSSTRSWCSIYRVPHTLRKHNMNAYDPQVVSIGPFHYAKRLGPLQALEEHKWRYLNDILSRNGEGSLQQYLVAVKKLENSLRDCYSEVITLDSNSFVEMMVLDACFLIELFRKYSLKDYRDDPIFQLGWLFTAIKADLRMLENQIPFFIIQCLYDMIDASCSPPHDLLGDRALRFLIVSESTRNERITPSGNQIQHLLHLVHTFYVLPVEYNSRSDDGRVIIPCASKLNDGGIEFKKSDYVNGKDGILNIKFDNGMIEIPALEVWDGTNVLFLNIIAFEECYNHCRKYITSYIIFTDYLIDTSKDVEILCRKGIFENMLGNEELVAALFNNMGRELTLRTDYLYLSGVCKEIDSHSKRTWPKLRATLVHDYFNNPWVIISFLAAVILLLFTMIQTFFASFPSLRMVQPRAPCCGAHLKLHQ